MLVARAFQVRGNAQKPRVHFNGLNSELTKSVVIMARIPGAVVKSVPWPSGALDLTPEPPLFEPPQKWFVIWWFRAQVPS